MPQIQNQPVANQPPTVLLVEDSATIAALMKHFLQRYGFSILVAGNGRDGIEMARREKPDVVISDLYMPDMDGIDLAKALRNDALTSGTAILMVTSETSAEKQQEALSAGVDEYLLKPVEPPQLVSQIKAVLSRTESTASR